MTTNHPAHGPVSLDRLHQIRQYIERNNQYQNGGNIAYILADMLKVIDVAIAAFGAEPVGEVVLGEYDDCGSYPDARVVCIAADGQAYWENFKDGTRLYAVNPAQVSIDERAAFNAWNNDENLPIAGVGAKNAAWLAWQARATMLQSFGNSEQLKPLSHGVKFPLDYLQGHKDGLEWAAQLAEANHPQTGDWLYDDPIELAGAIRKGPDMPTVQDGNSPATPDGWALVPKRLTAENGAKGVLSGEFSETKYINCPECFGDDECETCDSSGRIEITVPVSWTNIKAIWAKGVEHFEAAPQQENV